MAIKRICVLGLGYMGLPLACLFASGGYYVIGVDINKGLVDKLKRGDIKFDEPGMNELFSKAFSSGNFKIMTSVEKADAFVIAVPTPLIKDKKMAELKYVKLAAEMIYPHLRKGNVVILESTVPPNTCKEFILPILEKSGLKVGEEIGLAHCPERALPGNTLHELVNNDRIIGGIDKQSGDKVKEIYFSFVRGKIYLTDITTAETVKLIENTFRDVNIALANEFALIAEKLDINVLEAISLANKHPRVSILKPGPGVGGHCIPIDPWFIIERFSEDGVIGTARKINDSMPMHIFKIIQKILNGIEKPKITIAGVSYKADVDDARESPAIKIIELANKNSMGIEVTDPHVKRFEYDLCSFEKAVKGSDCIVFLVAHNNYLKINPEGISSLVRHKNIFDVANFLDHDKWRKAGFKTTVFGTPFE